MQTRLKTYGFRTMLLNIIGLAIFAGFLYYVALALRFDFVVSVAAVGLDRIVATLVYSLIGWMSIPVLGRHFSQAPGKPSGRQA